MAALGLSESSLLQRKPLAKKPVPNNAQAVPTASRLVMLRRFRGRTACLSRPTFANQAAGARGADACLGARALRASMAAPTALVGLPSPGASANMLDAHPGRANARRQIRQQYRRSGASCLRLPWTPATPSLSVMPRWTRQWLMPCAPRWNARASPAGLRHAT